MSKTVLLFILLTVLFAFTHFFATVTSLYWYLPQFDILMHLWGGMLVALGAYSLAKLKILKSKPSKGAIFLTAFLVMVGWEIFERINGLFIADAYLLDTIKDIIVGFVGVIIGYIFLRKK